MICEDYPVPEFMKREDNTARFAFVTLLMLNDSYLPGVLMLAYALKKQQSQADLVCLVSHEISEGAREALYLLYDRVIEVNKTFISYGRTQKRQHTPFVLTRLNALRLGADGDLGCCYEKIGLLDADLLPIKYYDHLFRLKTPAGVINEHKDYFIEYDACGNYVLPSDFAHTGTWRWHCEYGSICGHGQPIPKRVTDRVCTDPSNMGIHGAIFMIKPDMREFQAIQGELSQSKICRRIGEQYPWPDMQYLTQRWSGYWTNVDLRFCGFKGYPTLSVLFGTHYAGIKPWQLDRSRKCWQWVRYEDFRYWFRIYNQMVRQDYPKLCKYPSLKKLLRCIHKLQGGRGAREQGGI